MSSGTSPREHEHGPSPASTRDSPVTAPSRTPRRVQWASKNRVEHFEQVPSRGSDEDDEDDDFPRSLDEHGSDPAALARLHRALEAYLQPSRASTSKSGARSKDTRRTTAADPPRPNLEPSVPGSTPPSLDPSTRQHHPYHTDLDERVYVSAGETAGLPLPLSERAQGELNDGGDEEIEVAEQGEEEQRVWAARARDLVRAHTKRRKDLGSGKEDKWVVLRRRTREVLDEKHDEKDLEVGSAQNTNIGPLPLGAGHGVLSTLLTLYNAHGSGTSSAGTSSAGTSRAPSPSRSEASEEDMKGGTDEQLEQLPVSCAQDEAAPRSEPVKDKPTMHIPLPHTAPPGKGILSALPTPAHIPKLHMPTPGTRGGRPKAATNAGGVVGTLIATAGNITGAAAPAPSSVAPSVGRRGWGLTRYEIAPEEDAGGHRRTRSAPTTPLSQPPAEGYFDVAPATPPHTGSSTPRKNNRASWATLVDWLPRVPGTDSRPSSRLPSPTGWLHDREDKPAEGETGSVQGGRAYRRGRKERRRKAEIFITKHVAEIMQRQEFLLKLARALMMFAAPTHRLQAQIQATARVLDLEVSTLYLPNVMLISFGDAATSTSNLKFIQQASSLDLGKLLDAHRLYWKVIHDDIAVSSASASLDFLMRKPPLYRGWHVVLVGGLCSAAICPLAFSGSFVDTLAALPLGALLVLVQNLSSRNELYSNVFEITIATLLSFISAGLASTSHFCYAALASSSVVLILPGFFVLCGSLELASRQIVSGAVRICFAVIYSLFLGFGIAMGADVYSRITGLQVVGTDDFTCASSHHPDGPWWQRTTSVWWAFLCVPLYSLFLSLRNQAPLLHKEMLVTILISCGGWAANHFAGVAFVNRPDIQSALGAFAVGIVANIYAKFFSGNAYVVMITGILFQLPSGLANGGLLKFAAIDNKGQQFESYQAGFQVALQLVAVAIGLTVGLFTSVVVVHPMGGGRRRAAGLFSL